MKGDYKNLEPQEFVEFVIKYSGLSGYKRIGLVKDRELYRLN